VVTGTEGNPLVFLSRGVGARMHLLRDSCRIYDQNGTTPASDFRNVKGFRGGLVFKAHRLMYHSTLGLRVMKKKMENS